ncbi:hypothetical protein [Methylobacterium iners]|uniref:Uncharacterized protein n=1 Tax=Methylobacterium iners TaxID=418707 RepID=A0ABQ4RTA6_9HYPH|nr:hypothetical protein [Methylobacterium iners]GJD92939.1 hypothetical protein OCOJLMKI_0122 [Methylobacterium iners]
MNQRRSPEETLEAIAARLDEVAGQTAALIAYVAHLPGADVVQPRDLRSTLASMAPPRLSREAPESPFDVATRTANQIAEMARQFAALRSSSGR